MKISRLFLPTSLIVLLFQFPATCQRTPASNAIQLPDSLVFAGSAPSNAATVTYNPLLNKYYSIRCGGTGINFPLQTWNQTGGMPIFQDTASRDTRGIWWNPNTNQVERNSFNAIGWSTIVLDGSGNATHNFSILFTGQHQPTIQSVGAYDFKTNTVLFNSSGAISVYDRNTATLINSFLLTGTSLTNINTESVIYTGETGFEIGILDFVAKRVLLFNRVTGAFSGMSQLPASAITHSQFRFCYANNRVWLFNQPLKKWNSYNIWNQPLPIHLVSFIPTPKNNKEVNCKWTTASEINNDFFTLERSNDGSKFERIGEIKGAGNSTSDLNYFFTDEHPYNGISYYRLKQTDFNGAFTYSKIASVNLVAEENIITNAFPNPFINTTTVQLKEDAGNAKIELIDAAGKNVTGNTQINYSDNKILISKSNLEKGAYYLLVSGDKNQNRSQIKLIIQ